MSNVMQDKHEKEKKAAAAEEKRKREARRRRELGNAVNGADTPEDDEEVDGQQVPVRSIPKSKEARSMSPAVGRDGNRLAHAVSAPNGGPPSGGRDSFLNYFFGKENGARDASMPGQSAAGCYAWYRWCWPR